MQCFPVVYNAWNNKIPYCNNATAVVSILGRSVMAVLFFGFLDKGNFGLRTGKITLNIAAWTL